MRCRKCGAEINDDMLYCPKCGTHIPISEDEISDEDIALYKKAECVRRAGESEKTAPAPEKKKNRAVIVLLCVLIFVVLLGIAGGLTYVMMTDHSDTLKNSLDIQNSAARQTPPVVTAAPAPTPEPERTPAPTAGPKEEVPEENPSYSVYTDAEFNFSCSYPDVFEAYIDSTTSGRYTLRSKDKTAVLRICAEKNSAELTMEQSLSMFKAQKGGREDYSSAGETYYAVRMINGGTCFYKYLRCKNGNMYWFELEYPERYMDIYEGYVTHIYNSFTVN